MTETTKVMILSGVREYTEGHPVQLGRRHDGRLTIIAYNECGNNYTEVDLLDVVNLVNSAIEVRDAKR